MRNNFKNLYKVLIVVCSLLVFLKNYISNAILIYREYISPHITNFSFTVILCLLMGAYIIRSKKHIVCLCAVLCIANLLCETIIFGAINTPDITDAIFGVVGAVASLGVVLVTNKYGLKQSP